MRFFVSNIFLLILLLAGISSHVKAAQEATSTSISLAWNFDNGSLGDWSISDADEITLHHAEGSGGLWYLFRIDGVLEKTLTFIFPEVRKDYFGGDALPYISYDQLQWFPIENRIIQPAPDKPNSVRFSFTHTFATNRAWIAFTPPFTNPNLDRMIQSASEHPHVSMRDICESHLKSLPIPVLTITDPSTIDTDKTSILIVAREDAYESASSWLAQGVIDFLMSDAPLAAALKRRCVFHIIPLFDRDGVALGTALHPLNEDGATVYWTETWTEETYSFYEQRRFKSFLQDWKDKGRRIHYAFRFHAKGWEKHRVFPEYTSESGKGQSSDFFKDLLAGKYLSWYLVAEPALHNTRLSAFIHQLFPGAVTGTIETDWIYQDSFADAPVLYKTIDDFIVEGELLLFAIAEQIGIPLSDPPPSIHAASISLLSEDHEKRYSASCVYRDLQGKKPQYVRIVVNDKPYELTPVLSSENRNLNYAEGVLYSGFVSINQPSSIYQFQASNGSRKTSVPANAPRLLSLPN